LEAVLLSYTLLKVCKPMYIWHDLQIILSKCTEIINEAYDTHVRETLGGYIFFCLPDCWLVVSMHPECSMTGHVETGYFDFPVFKQMQLWFPSSKLLLSASHTTLSI
jgi:hypothetical protein